MKWIEVEAEGGLRRLINTDRIVAVVQLKHIAELPMCEIRFENTHSIVAKTSYKELCEMLGYITVEAK